MTVPNTPSVVMEATRVAEGRGARGWTSVRRYGTRVVYTLSLLLIIGFLADGLSYYTTPYSDRPHHEDYRTLRPAGTRGLVFGMIGTGMMVAMHLYSVRKRFRHARRLGSVQRWLDWHIYLGIMGPLFIMLHTSFKFNGLVAISFWSMVAVALSGFVGRYLYQQIPRNIRGEQLSLEDLRNQLETYPITVGEQYGLTKGAIARIEELSEPEVVADSGAFRTLFRSLGNDMLLPLTTRRYRRELSLTVNLPRAALNELATIVRQKALLKRRILYWGQLRLLFYYWHVIHKPFATVMYVIMAVHIGIALWTGYGWVA